MGDGGREREGVEEGGVGIIAPSLSSDNVIAGNGNVM